MKLLGKIYDRLTDPVFYRKRMRDLMRGFRSFDDDITLKLGCFHELREVIVVIAHPDDEVFCSGLICEMKQLGAKVSVVCVTKGEGGPSGDHPREILGRVRSEEMKKSCEVLGVDTLTFLGHVDPIGRRYRVFAPEISVEELATQILPHLEQGDLVISHGSSGEYWHPGHLLVFEAVKEALSRIDGDSPTWMTFAARQPDHPLPKLINWDDAAFLMIDGQRHEQTRSRALGCHRTQLGLFSSWACGDHLDFIRYTGKEAYALQRAGRNLKISESTDKGVGNRDHRSNRIGEITKCVAEGDYEH